MSNVDFALRSQRIRLRFNALVVASVFAGMVIAAALVAPRAFPIRAEQLGRGAQSMEFLDRSGLALGTLLSRDQEHTLAVPLSRVSPQFIRAMLAAEDARFYSHGAVDARSIARAMGQLIRHRHVVSGASTIEMQLARLLRPVRSTIAGKLYEMWIAQRLEAGMSKDEILEAYVNRAPMGGNVYGVEAAARSYLGVSAADLDLAQASLLAAIPNDPERLNPYENSPALKLRQAYVLERMVADRYITQAQADRARAENVSLEPRSQGIVAAPHLLFWLADRLPARATRVRTTIDRPLQQFVEEQVRQVIGRLQSRSVHQAAVLVIDNHSGEVLAYAGSADYFSGRYQGRNDGVQALRQPGSALKPFLYELALESRAIKPNSILADVPTRYAIPGGLLYSPSDYNGSFQGPVRVRIALADSLNVPAVRVLAQTGVPAFLNRLHELGFAHLDKPADYYGLGLTLGAGEVSLWELTRAYATMARGGAQTELRATLDGAMPDGAIRASESPVAMRTVGDLTAWSLVTDIIADPHARAKAFGFGSVLDTPFGAAVKTGTSSDFRDTWTVGFTRDYTVGVWVGNFNGEPMRQVSGVTGAAPLWSRIIMHLHERADPAPFDPPQGLVARPICADSGLRPTPACRSVVQEYLYPEDLTAYEKSSDTFAQSREYDEWRALAHPVAGNAGEFRILFPQTGDVFVRKPDDRRQAIPLPPQLLEFEALAPRSVRVLWRLNGRVLMSDGSAKYFWPLHPGRWGLEASIGTKTDRVTFDVLAAGNSAKRLGFSVAPQGR